MNDFVPPRDRDASATIRGFVYQVDLTIIRWLSIGVGTRLELERGEDIDEIVRNLGDSDSTTRTLEQAKVRSRPVTLRSADAHEALANAAHHLQSNPGVDLRFRFTTTATVGREQRHPRPDLPKGIVLWENFRTAPETVSSDAPAVLREIVAGGRRPPDVPTDAWAALDAILASDASWKHLVATFEWSTGQPSPEHLSGSVVRSLVERGFAPSPELASRLYERLFLYVFRLLARDGAKTLSSADLRSELDRGGLTSDDRAVLSELRRRLREFDVRVDALEDRMATVGDVVSVMAERLGVSTSPLVAAAYPEIGPPPLVEHLTGRTHTVAGIIGNARNSAWIAMRGPVGIGKTHLAHLTAKSIGSAFAWLRFTDIPTSHGPAYLRQGIATALRETGIDVAGRRAEELTGLIPSDAVIVLDDVPRMQAGDPLSNVLVATTRVLQKSGARLVSTSLYPLPRRTLEAAQITELEAPPFTDEECAELLRAYGGKSIVESPKTVTTLNAVSRGHATLLTALANCLRERSWRFDHETLMAIIDGDYATSTQDETLSALIRLTADERTRELIYRLQLAGYSVDLDDARAVGRVPPCIDHVDARVHTIKGVWLQPVRNGRYELSPMLGVLPKDQLTAEVRRRCHAALADKLQRQPLNQNTAVTLITHHLKAERFDAAGLTLGLILARLEEEEALPPPGMLLDLWWSTPLPEGMSRGMRLFLRDTQARVGSRYGRDPSRIELELDSLAEEVNGIDTWGLVVVAVRRFRRLFKLKPDVAATWMQRGLAALTHSPLRELYGEALPTLAPLIWTIVPDVRSRQHVRAWLGLVEALPASERRWDGDDGDRVRTACHLVTNGRWVPESVKPAAEQRFAENLEDLEEIARRARALNFAYLEACALRGIVSIVCEFSKKFDEGMARADGFLLQSPDDYCTILIRDVVGRQLFHAGRFTEALAVLEPLTHTGARFEPLLCGLAANYASRATAELEPANHSRALACVERAVEIADELPNEIGEFERVRSRGELAIALARAGDHRRACAVLLQAGEELVRHPLDLKHWHEVTVGIAQVTLVVLASAGLNLPTNRSRSSQPPSLPQRGYFFWRDDLEKLWRPDFPALFAFQMWDAATAIQDEDAADRWVIRFLDSNVPTDGSLGTSISIMALPHLIATGRDDAIVRAIDLARQFAASVGMAEGSVDLRSPEGALGVALFLPVVLWLSETTVLDPAYAARVAVVVSARLRTLARLERSPGGWERAAQLLERTFTPTARYRELLQAAHGEADFLRTCAYLLSTTAPDVPVAEAASIQSQLVEQLWTGSLGFAALHGLTTRWLVAYWTTSFHRSKFLFASPALVAHELAEAVSLPMRVRARRVLGTIVSALRVSKDERFVRWLRAAD